MSYLFFCNFVYVSIESILSIHTECTNSMIEVGVSPIVEFLLSECCFVFKAYKQDSFASSVVTH